MLFNIVSSEFYAEGYGSDKYKLVQYPQTDFNSEYQAPKRIPIQFSNSQSSLNDSIKIKGNVNFTDQVRIRGWHGNGTKSNPYIINNLNVSNHHNSIDIENTDLYFSIINCSLINGTNGILLTNVKNVFIFNNIIENNIGYGIQIQSSINITLHNNTISNSLQGIQLYFSKNITISNNRIYDNKGAGVSIFSSRTNQVINNSLINNGLIVNGTHINDFQQFKVANNSVNGKPLIFWFNRIDGDILTDVGQVILINCTSVRISDQKITNATIGLYLAFSTDLLVINSSFSYNSKYGIYLFNSTNSVFTNNLISHNGINGISLEFCSTITISANFIFDNLDGIFLASSDSNNVLSNFIYNNKNGFDFFLSSNNSLAKNTIYNNEEGGIYFLSSKNNRILDNFLINNGFVVNGTQISDFWQTEVKNNLVNGKPLVYWYNVTNGDIPRDAGQIILLNCKNLIITKQNLINASLGLFVAFCTNLIITENTISYNNRFGAYFFNSSNNSISSNLINNNKIGISLYNTGNNDIDDNALFNNGLFIFGDKIEHYLQKNVSNNTINEKKLVFWQNKRNTIIPQNTSQVILLNCSFIEITGLYLSNVPTSVFGIRCSNLTISSNRIFSNLEGIKLIDSVNITINANFIFNNEQNGIIFENSSNNIIVENSISHNGFSACVLVRSTDNTVSTNSMYNNSYYGVVLDLSHDNWISNNFISKNQKYGVDIDHSENNTISKNNFIGNNPDADSQVKDQDNEGRTNQFSNNYWEDWGKIDKNDDGMIEETYQIDGSSDNTDPLPKIEPISIHIYLLTTPVIKYPKVGSILQDIVLLEWEVSYSYKPQTIYYVIYYTTTELPYIWSVLVTSLTNSSYNWDTRLVPDSSNYKLAVVAYDPENLRAIHVLYSFSIQNELSTGLTGLTLLKILIILNLTMILSFLFISSFVFFGTNLRFTRRNWFSKDFILNYLQHDLKSSIIRGKWILLAIITAFFLSVLRALIFDPILVVNDGYDSYAIGIRSFLFNFSSPVDEVPQPKIRFRITYPTIIAILLPSSAPLDIIFIGRLISILSFFLCIYYLGKLIEHFKSISETINKERILIVFILNPTIITNIVRFETDILFLGLSFYILHNYLNFIDHKSSNIQKLSLVLAIVIFLFTREVGIFLFFSLLLHYFIFIPRKFKYLIISISSVCIVIGFWLNILQDFIFYALWSASTYTYAYEIIYKNNWLVIIDIILLKVTNEYIFSKTIESIIYSFFPAILFFLVGFFRLYLTEDKIGRKKILTNIISIYFSIYIIFYLVLKSGRGLDRFWIPILAFPLLILLYTIDLNDLKSRIIHLIRYRSNSIKSLTFSSEHEPPSDNKETQINNLKVKNKLIIPKSTFIFIIIIQLAIYLIRLILSQISNLFIFGIR